MATNTKYPNFTTDDLNSIARKAFNPNEAYSGNLASAARGVTRYLDLGYDGYIEDYKNSMRSAITPGSVGPNFYTTYGSPDFNTARENAVTQDSKKRADALKNALSGYLPAPAPTYTAADLNLPGMNGNPTAQQTQPTSVPTTPVVGSAQQPGATQALSQGLQPGQLPGLGGAPSAQQIQPTSNAQGVIAPSSIPSASNPVQMAATPQPSSGASIPFKPGLSPAQQASIQQLATKPQAQWTSTDIQNWNYATNNAPRPVGTQTSPATPSVPGTTPSLGRKLGPTEYEALRRENNVSDANFDQYFTRDAQGNIYLKDNAPGPALSGGSPAAPGTPGTGGTGTPGTGGTPLVDPTDALLKAYLDSLKPSAEQTKLQGETDALTAQAEALERQRQGVNNDLENQPIARGFITGQQAAVNKDYDLQRGVNQDKQQTLQQKLAREQAKLQSASDISKYMLERADTKSAAEKKAASEQYSLSAGENRYDSKGNLIAKGADKPETLRVVNPSKYSAGGTVDAEGNFTPFGGSTPSPSPSPSTPPVPKQTALQIDTAKVASQLKSRAGVDKYVSPADYKTAKAAWVESGRSASSFDSTFRIYVNPSHASDYTGTNSSKRSAD